jgi:flagellar protein FliO/FliZ
MLTNIIIFVLLVVAVAAGYLFLRSMQSGQSISDMLFAPRAEKRLGVLEMTPVDGRRRLVLVRRDDVEHLIMIGGPVDVVIETSIGQPSQPTTGRVRSLNGAKSNEDPRDTPPCLGVRRAR